MKIVNIIIFIFLLAALTVGSSLTGVEREIIDGALNNATETISNIELDSGDLDLPNINGLFNVLEKYIQFIGSVAIEVFRSGVYFGQDNPSYFEPNYVASIMQLIIYLIIISLLIKPVGYVLIFVVMGIMYLTDKIKNRKKKVHKKIIEENG